MTFQAYRTTRYLPAGLFRAKIKNSFPSIFFVDRWRTYSSFPSFTEPSSPLGRRFPQRFFFSTFLCLGLLLCFISFLSILFMTLFIFGYISERFYNLVFQFCTKRSLETGKVEAPTQRCH